MKLLSKVFIPIYQRKWNDILAAENVWTGSLAWKISKKVTKLTRHQKLHRDIDQTIYWCSLLLMSQWLGFMHGGSNKPSFRYCDDSLTIMSCILVPSKVTQEEM